MYSADVFICVSSAARPSHSFRSFPVCLAGLSPEALQTSINEKMLLEMILDKSFPNN